jgi:hypothetical protein
MRSVLRKYYLLLVCTISLFTANNSLQAQNVLDQAGLTSATPAVAAYATRKLSSSYTGAAVRIRRASDNAVADVAFDVNGTISANSMATFVSGGTGSVALSSFAAATNAFVSIWYDQSGNSRHATQTTAANQPLLISNGIVVTSSVLNSKATLSFNGSGQFMDLPMSSSIINAAGTISAVQVQPVLQTGFNAVVAWSLSGGTQGPGFGPLNSPGAFGLYTTWGPNNITLGPVAVNQAYVLNASWSGNGSTVVQSRNGTIVNGSLGASFNYTGNAWIGRDAGATYSGNLAELIVSNTTITAGNRTAMEANQNNAYTNAGALNFDGSNDYVNLGNILGASYTKEAWVNISNAAAVNNFISGGSASKHAFWAPNAYGNKLSAGHNEIWNQVQDPTALVVGQWYHVAVTYDAPTTTMKLYKNGVLVSTNNAVPAYVGGGNVVLLGAYEPSLNLLSGSLDETRIWSRVLCQTEIQNNMNAMLSGTQTGLTAYYKFNQGITAANNSTITTVSDASGNNYTGAMVGFNLTGSTSNWVAGTVSPTAVSPVFTNPSSVISGASSICVNATTTLTNASTGTWSSSNTSVATVSASGLVTGVSAGSAVISFTNICGAVSSKLITVSAIPTISIANPTPNVNLGNSATLTASSNLGKAIQFNGTNSVEMAIGVVLPNTFTQEAWIFSTSGADNAYHGFLGNTAASTNAPTRSACMYVFNGNTLHGGFGDGTAFYYYITQPGVIAPNTWYHVAQTFDGTTLKCYVNGVQVPLASVVNNPAGKTPAATPVKSLGKLDNNFVGTIDEVRMWNTVRTPAQLQADMNKGVPVNSTGLVAYWKLDEGIGTSTYDIKQGTIGTLIGSPVWVASTAPIGGAFTWSPSYGLNNSNSASVIASPPYTTTYTATVTDGTSGCAVSGTTVVTVFDIPGKAIVLDGTNDYVKVADNASLDFGSNDFTIETWTLKKANSSGYTNSGIVGKWNTGAIAGTNEWILNNTVSGSDNKPAFWIESGNTIHQLNGTTVMNIGEWYHLAIVRKGTLMSMYVNGVLNASITIPAGTVLNNVGRDMLMGAYQFNAGNPTIYSSVTIDELRIWNRAVCLDEMNNNRSGELSGTQNGLLAYYKFNKGFYNGNNVGVSLVLPDISGNNNNGTLINFAETATGNWTTSYFNGPNPVFVPTTAPITGITSACIGATSTLANTNQGVWSSSNTTVATVNAAGVVTAIADGTTTITFTNTCGGISTTTFTVNPKPTASISTASPLTVCLGGSVLLDASTNASAATYQWFKNGQPIPTATNASFNAIASGSYSVVISNASGCVSNTSTALVVTIEDIIKPFFSSVGTITSATNAQGQVLATSALGAVVTYNAPVGADNCTVVSNVLTAGYASGSVFPIGTTTVTYTITDAAGLTETSSFDVVVSGLVPAIIAPANITVNNDEGQCGATVSFAATGSLGSPAATITYTEDGQPVTSGSSFAVGVHTITATATNAVGSSSVHFTITVVNTDHPTITAQGPTNFCENGSVTLTASEGSSYYWNTGETTQSITVYSAGDYSASVTNAFGCPTNTNTITTTTITIPTAPEITGAGEVCANSSTVLTSDITGGVWSSENESIATVDAQGKVTGVSEGSVQIMYAVTNESGCTSIGYFTLYVKPLPLPGVITGNTEICAGVTSRLDVTNPNGRNDDRSVWTTSNASVVTISEFPSGIDITGIGLGTATITKTLTLNGCTAVIATAVVTVTNPAIPVITASGATAFCSGESVVLTASEGSSYLWSNGETTQSITVTSSGNYTVAVTNQLGCSATSAATTVTVNTLPIFTVIPENKTAYSITNQCSALVSYLVEATGVNTPTLTYSFTGATTGSGSGTGSGLSFNVGITNVTITASNQCGSSNVSFTVTVIDNIPPTFTSTIPNITIEATSANGAIFNYTLPAAFDNCSSNVLVTALPVSGSLFAIGNTTVTIVAVDNSGNSTQSTFIVTVKDTQLPIVKTKDLTVYLNSQGAASITAADVNNNSTDNTGIASMSVSPNSFNCADLTTGNGNTVMAYTGATPNGIQNWGGTLGMDFNVVNPTGIVISQLGAFDHGQNGIVGTQAGGSIRVAVFNRNTQTIVPGLDVYIAGSSDPLVNFHRMRNVTPVTLPVGNYSIVALGYNGSELNGNSGVAGYPATNTNSNSGAIVFTGGARAGSTLFDFPGSVDSGPASRYHAGTFSYSTGNSGKTVVLSVIDSYGNTGTATAKVTVQDTIKPNIVAPANIIVNATSAAGAMVTYVAPVGTDNCSSTTVRTAGLASGSVFPIGVNTVTYTVTDASGNTASASFTVTVTGLSPAIVAPANISVNAQLNTCGAAVSFAATETTAIPASTITYTENGQPVVSGATFTTGVHTITATATNAVGSSSASFTITVVDNQAPVITAPADITVNASANCNAIITVPALVATDNCTVTGNALKFDGANDYVNLPRSIAGDFSIEFWMNTTQIGPNAGGSQWYQGIGIVDAEVGGVTNDFGIALLGNKIGFGVGAPDRTIFSTSNVNTGNWVHIAATRQQSNGQIKLYVNGILQATGTGSTNLLNTPSRILIGLMQTSANGYFNGAITKLRLWNSVRTVTEITNNMSATLAAQTGLVANYEFNQGVANGNNTGINTLINTVSNTNNGTLNNFGLTGTNSNWVAGVPSASITVTNNFNNTANASGMYPVGVTNIVWTATDAAGNASTYTQKVTVLDVTPPTISNTNSVTYYATSAAGATVTYPTPVGMDNCSGVATVLTTGLPSGSTFPIGVTTVTYTATDAAGLTASTSFTVTVVGIAPVIVVPENILQNNDAGQCGAVVSFAATETTAIPASTIVYTEDGQTIVSGHFFSVGTHTITATATNAVGSVSADFTITVQDVEAPKVFTQNMTVALNAAGQASISAAQINVGSTDNCGIASVVISKENFDCSNLGTNTVTLTVTDVHGNIATATATVSVIDTQAPTFNVSIPADVTAECNAVPAAAVLTAVDNCSAVVTMTEVRTDGNSVNDYTLTRTWTATDASGNNTVRKQVITVRDTQAPSLSVPANISVFTDNNTCGAVVSFAATATDNCSPASISYSHNPGTVFPVGITTVTVTATDPSGNATVLSFTVSVTDKQAPTAIAKNITLGLSAVGGTVSITAADVNNGSSDACGIASMTVMPASFSCANVGANTVTLTVTDVNGNVSTTTAIVTVVDDKGPVPTAVLPVISGQCSVKLELVSRIHQDGDGCNSNDRERYHRNKKGKGHDKDSDGRDDHNDDDDDDDNGAIQIVAPTAMDNCSGLIKGTTTDPLTYNNQGTYIIHWKFVDARGNVTIQEQTVIVKDTEAPRPKYASLPTITGQCSVSLVNTNSNDDDGDHEGRRDDDDHDGDDDHDRYNEHQMGAPWAKDNCSGWVRGTTTDPLTYSVQGTYIIHWTYNDGHGNISTQNQTVIVKDITKPKIKAPNDKTVTCGNNTAPAVMGMATATDNCSVPVITYTDVNSNNQIVRTWKATDAAGNISTAVQTIKLSTAFSGSVVSVPTSNVYTGGEANNLYLGYGAQGTALTVTSLPSSGAPYTYSWIGVATNRLSATNTGAPVFSPTAGGVYTFTVTMTNKNGCSNTASISICVTDIRVPGSNGALVYVCHKGSGKTGGTKTLQVPVAQVASHIQSNNCGGKNDRLGSCDQNPCNSGNDRSEVDPKQQEEPIEVKPDVKTAAAPVVEELKVVVMPNPTTTYFTIRLESKDKAPVNLRVMDGSGRVIDAKQKMEPNSSFQMGHGYSSGTYYAEFIQGNKRKVIQLIKGRG